MVLMLFVLVVVFFVFCFLKECEWKVDCIRVVVWVMFLMVVKVFLSDVWFLLVVSFFLEMLLMVMFVWSLVEFLDNLFFFSVSDDSWFVMVIFESYFVSFLCLLLVVMDVVVLLVGFCVFGFVMVLVDVLEVMSEVIIFFLYGMMKF